MPPTPQLPRRSLLLLPPGPSPLTYASVKAAYGPSLLAVLRKLTSSTPRKAVGLDIALPCPHLYGQLDAPRSPFYAATQSLVANIYKLICVIAAQESIATEGAEGVDARVLLVAYPRDGKLVQPLENASAEEEARGPVVDLHTLARCPRSWDTVFSVDNEEGETLLKNFVALSAPQRNVTKVEAGIVEFDANHSETAPVTFESKHHSAIAVGGTFDHIHIGHKHLLTMFAFVLARQPPSEEGQMSSFTVGITGDELLKNKKYAEVLESWDRRQEMTHEFLSALLWWGQPQDSRIRVERKSEPGPNGHAVHVIFPGKLVIKYVQIMDPFGPTITDESITALVISKETRSGGKAVNDKRAEKGWAELEVFEVDVLDAGELEDVDETFQSKLSSTEIRKNLMERSRSS